MSGTNLMETNEINHFEPMTKIDGNPGNNVYINLNIQDQNNY